MKSGKSLNRGKKAGPLSQTGKCKGKENSNDESNKNVKHCSGKAKNSKSLAKSSKSRKNVEKESGNRDKSMVQKINHQMSFQTSCFDNFTSESIRKEIKQNSNPNWKRTKPADRINRSSNYCSNKSVFVDDSSVIDHSCQNSSVSICFKKKKPHKKTQGDRELSSKSMLKLQNPDMAPRDVRVLSAMSTYQNTHQGSTINRPQIVKRQKNRTSAQVEKGLRSLKAAKAETNKSKLQSKSKDTSVYSSIVDMKLPISKSSSFIDFSDKSCSMGSTINDHNIALEQMVNFLKTNKFKEYKQEDRSQIQIKRGICSKEQAALLIQKTFRGYMTRKLLKTYIESLEPLYSEKLNSIIQQRSRSESQRILVHGSLIIHDSPELETFIEHSAEQAIKSETEINDVLDGSPIESRSFNRSFAGNFPCQNILRDRLLEMPCQIKGSQPSIYRIKNGSYKDQKEALEEETVGQSRSSTSKDNIETQIFSHRSESSRKRNQLKLQRNLVSISCHQKSSGFNSFQLDPAHRQQTVHSLGQQFEKLFMDFDRMCIELMKSALKQKQLQLNQFLERKRAVEVIKNNSFEFIQNVQNEVKSALKEMHRISEHGEASEEQIQSQESQNDEPEIKFEPLIYLKDGLNGWRNCPSQQNRPLKVNLESKHQSHSPCSQDSASPYGSERKPSRKRPCSEVYMVELPTEQYSAKAIRSPIPEDGEEQLSEKTSSPEMVYVGNSEEQYSSEASLSIDGNRRMAQCRQSIQILNQFLHNLVEESANYCERQENIKEQKGELEFMCETLTEISSNNNQTKTVIDRCLIEFMVEIITENVDLKQLYEAFASLVDEELQPSHNEKQSQYDDQTLMVIVRRWIKQLDKWEMKVIEEVGSGLEEGSSFLNTQNISFQSQNQICNESPNSDS